MPEITDDSALEAHRFVANQKQMENNKHDEDLIEELAQFAFVTADEFYNPNCASAIRDLANKMILNKDVLAKTQGDENTQPMTPEEQMAQQQMAAQQQGMPPQGAY